MSKMLSAKHIDKVETLHNLQKLLCLLSVLVLEAGMCVIAQHQGDTLQVKRLEISGDTIRLNLPELDKFRHHQLEPLVPVRKPWLKFDTSLPGIFPGYKHTIDYFNAYKSVRYDYDPIYKRKITSFYGSFSESLYHAFHIDSYLRSLPKTPKGQDLMLIFTKDFWDFKKKANHKATYKALREYDKVIPELPLKKSVVNEK